MNVFTSSPSACHPAGFCQPAGVPFFGQRCFSEVCAPASYLPAREDRIRAIVRLLGHPLAQPASSRRGRCMWCVVGEESVSGSDQPHLLTCDHSTHCQSGTVHALPGILWRPYSRSQVDGIVEGKHRPEVHSRVDAQHRQVWNGRRAERQGQVRSGVELASDAGQRLGSRALASRCGEGGRMS